MKNKPGQYKGRVRLPFNGLATVLFLVLALAPMTAKAGADPKTGFLFFGGYPSCTVGPIPCGPFCCTTPDLQLMLAFRGPNVPAPLNTWYKTTFWKPLGQELASMANQINANVINQAKTRGTFLEGQNNLKAIGSLQQAGASTARNELPSEQLCRYGTLAQSLSSSDASAKAVKIAMSKVANDRQLLISGNATSQNTTGTDGNPGTTQGQSADKMSRWGAYVSKFCDPADLGQGSGSSGVCQGSTSEQYNRDINYTRTVDNPLTLDINGVSATKDQENINALSQNLYANDLVNNVSPATFDPDSEDSTNQNRKYLTFLSAIAKRSVALNSFNSIVAMKSKGSPGTATYMVKLLEELGMTNDIATKLVADNPSYNAQMEVLTRRLYQSPSFYVNLMEGKANVKRQKTAMKSFELMQQRDLYESIKRSEMLFATLLELELANGQGDINQQTTQSK